MKFPLLVSFISPSPADAVSINSSSGTALAVLSFLLFSVNDLSGGFCIQLKVNGQFKLTFLYMLSAGLGLMK